MTITTAIHKISQTLARELDKAAPELARLLLDAPGTQIADVRRIGL